MRYSVMALRSRSLTRRRGRLAQRESASFTPRRSLVRSQYRPPVSSVAPAREARERGATGHVGRGGDPRGPHVPVGCGSSNGPQGPPVSSVAPARETRERGATGHVGRGGDPRGPHVPVGCGSSNGPQGPPVSSVAPAREARERGATGHGGRGGDPREPHVPVGC